MKPQFATSQEGRCMASTKEKAEIVPVTIQVNDIGNLIYTIRDKQVMLDHDLAALYGYEVRALNQQVNFNAQYPTLTVKKTQVFHDRFIILDGKTAYHIGASIKDAGKKCFGISLIDDPGLVTDLLNRLKTV